MEWAFAPVGGLAHSECRNPHAVCASSSCSPLGELLLERRSGQAGSLNLSLGRSNTRPKKCRRARLHAGRPHNAPQSPATAAHCRAAAIRWLGSKKMDHWACLGSIRRALLPVGPVACANVRARPSFFSSRSFALGKPLPCSSAKHTKPPY